jgi:hypothetical protein
MRTGAEEMNLPIDSEDAVVLRRVLRELLPQLQQEAYASENYPGLGDMAGEERAIQHVVETLEARLSRLSQQAQQQG